MRKSRHGIVVVGICALHVLHGAALHAQELGLPQDRPSERAIPLPAPAPGAPPALDLPPLEFPADTAPAFPALHVRVNDFRFVGNTVITAEELAAITEPHRGRDLGSDELEAIRIALTQYYIQRGFINSGAILPDQEIAAGVVTFQIIEGELTRIEVRGNRRLRESYVADRAALSAGPPLNVYAIRDRLFLLQQDPRIQRLDAALLPGTRPGEATLRIDLDEAPSRRAYLAVNNYRPPSIGAERAEVELLDYNLFGFGDSVELHGGVTEGSKDIDLSYAVPVNARDTAIHLRYARNSSTVVEPPFDELDVKGRAQTAGLGLWHYPHKTPEEQVGLGLTFEQRQSRSYLLGEPFAFSLGTPADGRVRVSVVRFAQSWLAHNPEWVLAARSTFSAGINAFDATIDPAGEPDARFHAWLGQLQWVERLFDRRDEVVTRVDTQLTDDPLLSLEQFSVGGAHSVRGYRENQLVRDNGLFTSVEYRWTLWSDPGRGSRVQLAGFFDWGRSWNRERTTPSPETLASVGVGLRANYHPWLEFELYYGSRLKQVADPDDEDLQDKGIHFQLRLRGW